MKAIILVGSEFLTDLSMYVRVSGLDTGKYINVP